MKIRLDLPMPFCMATYSILRRDPISVWLWHELHIIYNWAHTAIPRCDPICHAVPQVFGSLKKNDTTCRLPTSEPFVRLHTKRNPCATHRLFGPTGDIRPTGQRHRPQLIRRNLQKPNRTLRLLLHCYGVLVLLPVAFLFPSASPSNLSTPARQHRRSPCFRSPAPAPPQLARAGPGSVLRTNTATGLFQFQPIRPEPPHEPPKARILSCIYLFQFNSNSGVFFFALIWSQWAATRTAFPMPLA